MLYQFSFLYYALDNKCQFPFETTFKAWYYTSGKGETYIKFRRVGVIDEDEDLSSSGMEFSIDDEVG